MDAWPKHFKTMGQICALFILLIFFILLDSSLYGPRPVQASLPSPDALRAASTPNTRHVPEFEPSSTPTATTAPISENIPPAVEAPATVEFQLSDETPQPVPDVPAEDQERLLHQAARDAFESQVTDSSNFRIGHIRIVGDWALVNFRVTPPDLADQPASWDIYVGLARWNDTDWEVHLEHTPEFEAWLDEIPNELISGEARAFLEPQLSLASDAPGLLLPFPIGQTWKYLAGPYGGPRREAVDFGPFGVRERITPEPPPTNPLTGRERDVTASAAGVVIDKGSNLLILRHANFPAWETGYNSLAETSITKRIGDFVFRGERIGSASNQIDPWEDEHVQFWVRRRGVDQIINGQVLSEWRVYQDNGFESGQNAGRIVYKTGDERIDCRTVAVNDLDPELCHVKHYSVTPSPLTTSTVTISPSANITIPLGLTGVTEVIVEDTTNLFRVDLRLTYAPVTKVAVVDAFPGISGRQVAPGEIFDDQPATFIKNKVDVVAGVIEFAADLQVPAAAFSGTGSLIEINWLRLAAGEVDLKLDQVILADSNGRILPVVTVPGDEIKIQSGFLLNGLVELQGRNQWNNVTVTTAEQQVVTGADGRFSVGVGGPYQLSLTAPGYLSAHAEDEPRKTAMSDVELIDLGRVKLLGGEVTGDDQIDIFDLSFIASRLGGTDEQADLNGDGTVDIFDLTLSAANFGQIGPIAVSGE